MMNVRNYDGQTFQTFLTAFANEVNLRQYNKMPYEKWKNIKAIKSTDKIVVTIKYCGDNIPIITITVNNNIGWTFLANDHSFGEFFYHNNYINRTVVNPTTFDTQTSKINYINNTATINTQTDKIINEKETNEMKGFNFDFGPVNSDNVRMSMYGMAVKNKEGTYVSYDAKENIIMDVDIFNFNGSNFLYKMPVAIKDIAVGDVIVHQRVPMFVVDIPANNNTLIAIDPVAGERKEIMLARSPFGFNFVTKVVNFLGGMMDNSANSDNPFGNSWMMFALANNTNSNDMLPLMLMSQNKTFDPAFMMLWAARNNDNDMDTNTMLLMYLASQQNKNCNCGGNCSK